VAAAVAQGLPSVERHPAAAQQRGAERADRRGVVVTLERMSWVGARSRVTLAYSCSGSLEANASYVGCAIAEYLCRFILLATPGRLLVHL
jgi:hypothetical protein